jgi:hypothetical protein
LVLKIRILRVGIFLVSILDPEGEVKKKYSLRYKIVVETDPLLQTGRKLKERGGISELIYFEIEGIIFLFNACLNAGNLQPRKRFRGILNSRSKA